MQSSAERRSSSTQANVDAKFTEEVLRLFDELHPFHSAKTAKARNLLQESDNSYPEAKLAKAAKLRDKLDIEVANAFVNAEDRSPDQPLTAAQLALELAQLELNLRKGYAPGFSAEVYREYIVEPSATKQGIKFDAAMVDRIKSEQAELAAAFIAKANASKAAKKAKLEGQDDAAEPGKVPGPPAPPQPTSTPSVQSADPKWAATVMRHFDDIVARPEEMPTFRARVERLQERGLYDTPLANAMMMAEMKLELREIEPGLLDATFRDELALQMVSKGIAGDMGYKLELVTDPILIRALEVWEKGREC